MNEFEKMVSIRCESKQFQDRKFVIQQLIIFAEDVEFITNKSMLKEQVIDKLLQNLNTIKFSFTPDFKRGGENYYSKAHKEIGVLDLDNREYTLIHELIHALSLNDNDMGIDFDSEKGGNKRLNEGMTEYITKKIWQHRYPNKRPSERYVFEQRFASKIFNLLGEQSCIVEYFNNAQKIEERFKITRASSKEWDEFNNSLSRYGKSKDKIEEDKLRLEAEKRFKRLIRQNLPKRIEASLINIKNHGLSMLHSASKIIKKVRNQEFDNNEISR